MKRPRISSASGSSSSSSSNDNDTSTSTLRKPKKPEREVFGTRQAFESLWQSGLRKKAMASVLEQTDQSTASAAPFMATKVGDSQELYLEIKDEDIAAVQESLPDYRDLVGRPPDLPAKRRGTKVMMRGPKYMLTTMKTWRKAYPDNMIIQYCMPRRPYKSRNTCGLPVIPPDHNAASRVYRSHPAMAERAEEFAGGIPLITNDVSVDAINQEIQTSMGGLYRLYPKDIVMYSKKKIDSSTGLILVERLQSE